MADGAPGVPGQMKTIALRYVAQTHRVPIAQEQTQSYDGDFATIPHPNTAVPIAPDLMGEMEAKFKQTRVPSQLVPSMVDGRVGHLG